MKIGIIGAGKWGSALQYAFSQNPENEVYITSRSQKSLPNFITVEEMMQIEYLVFAISAQNARAWMQEHFIYHNQKILVASKGIEVESGMFLNELFESFLPKEDVAFISGPSFATEVKQGLPCALVINAYDKKLAKKFASFFPDFIKAYTSKDVIGAEVSGAYKNVIAIASGITEGLGLGNNARASLISRGLVEMMRFGRAFGAKKNSFIGLGGAGDLFLTASSNLSRNYRVGLALAEGKDLDTILKELGEVAEGVYTAQAIVKISKEKDIYTPIADEVYAILQGKNPKESLRDLLSEG
jgi:glycerol-3-phosphate dehydrogenase (NAD(P)+)